MTMAELELARSHIDKASRYAEMAIEVAERMGETANVGEAHAWRGRIAAAQEDDATADAEFEAAFELFEVAEAPERKTRNRAIYADILEARGDLAGANRQRARPAVVRPSWSRS
jgi:hypothetical protein